MTGPAQYIMIGGFLGAGKTTAMVRFASYLAAGGRRVGLITNDQSTGLADTRIAGHAGFPVREITGGCFCCRFNSLMDAADALARDAAPDVFLAEPVGSCTDLKATVSYPLRRLYGDQFAVAPFSVLVDPARAARVLGLEPGRRFSPKVLYVYEKQLEEADLIVINKVDAAGTQQVGRLSEALHERFPRARLLAISAREGAGLEEWFEAVLESADRGEADLPIDYDIYAEGEALLGWLNCTVNLSAGGGRFDGNAWLEAIVSRIQERLRGDAIEIAHLKATLTSAEAADELAVVQAADSEQPVERRYGLDAPIATGELVLNLRAEADPEILDTVVRECVAGAARAASLDAAFAHEEHFRPSRPVPTHRVMLT
jgi:Ni2+-binding GTPase involved in maturation of urease and hydrogenase